MALRVTRIAAVAAIIAVGYRSTLIAVQRRSEHQITVRPGLEPEIHNLLAIKIIDDVLEQHTRHLLLVFIVGGVEELRQIIEGVHAHRQLDGGFFTGGRAHFPVGDLTLVVFFAA